MDWSGLPIVSVVKKIPTKYPENFVFFRLGWVLESRRREDKRGRDWHVRLRAPYRNPLPPIHICLEKRRRVDQCRFAKYTSSNSDTCKSFGESGQHQIRFYNGEMQGYIFNPFPLLLFMLDKVKSPYMSEMG